MLTLFQLGMKDRINLYFMCKECLAKKLSFKGKRRKMKQAKSKRETPHHHLLLPRKILNSLIRINRNPRARFWSTQHLGQAKASVIARQVMISMIRRGKIEKAAKPVLIQFPKRILIKQRIPRMINKKLLSRNNQTKCGFYILIRSPRIGNKYVNREI